MLTFLNGSSYNLVLHTGQRKIQRKQKYFTKLNLTWHSSIYLSQKDKVQIKSTKKSCSKGRKNSFRVSARFRPLSAFDSFFNFKSASPRLYHGVPKFGLNLRAFSANFSDSLYLSNLKSASDLLTNASRSFWSYFNTLSKRSFAFSYFAIVTE